MKKEHEVLFTPMKIGKLTLKNRFIMCAMEGANIIDAQKGYQFNENCREYIRERARNHVALIIPGCVFVQSIIDGQWLYNQVELFQGPIKELMEEVHSYGSKLFLQIGAGGGRATAAVPMFQALADDPIQKAAAKAVGFDIDRVLQAPSANLPDVWNPQLKTTEMSREAIHEMVKAYGKTALLCKQSGIDGIEIHAIHEGYLLDQFTMNCTNHRTDAYGGNLENRMRFITEIIGEIKKVCGNDYPVSVRYSVESKMRGFNQAALPEEKYHEFGRNREESVQVARCLEAAGADLLNADNGTYDSWFWAHPPVYMPLACNLGDAAFIKQHVNIPVACAGRMEEPDTAAQAITSGEIDFVGIARQLLCDEAYITKLQEGRVEDIRPCIACHNGCFAMYCNKNEKCGVPDHPLGRCALNPRTFQEKKYEIVTAEKRKHIVVVGGGIGGMEVARLCAMRGHQVSLYEKSDVLGGVFIAAAAPPFKEKDRMLIQWYQRQMNHPSIQVHMETEVELKKLEDLHGDEYIIATGAVPRKVHIPGGEQIDCIEAIEYLLHPQQAGQQVAIIGGGLTGCEIAYQLALEGKKPVIIEQQNDILNIRNLSAANSNMLREIIRYYEIPVYTEAKVDEVIKGGLRITQADKTKEISCDTIIYSVGYVPRELPIEEDEHIHIIGDALQVGNLMNVIWHAYDVSLSL